MASKYTADGLGLSPPLSWTGVPATGTESLAFIVEDPDAPSPDPLVQVIVVDLPPHTTSLEEGALQSAGHAGLALHTGRNSYLTQAWLPPDPPPGHGPHRYVFQVFALGRGAAFSKAPGRREFFDRLLDRALAGGCLIGTYERL
jgi:Raf kinase inhibitor-like YbhB/YbcL family protein